jgi:hypothetical protein
MCGCDESSSNDDGPSSSDGTTSFFENNTYLAGACYGTTLKEISFSTAGVKDGDINGNAQISISSGIKVLIDAPEGDTFDLFYSNSLEEGAASEEVASSDVKIDCTPMGNYSPTIINLSETELFEDEELTTSVCSVPAGTKFGFFNIGGGANTHNIDSRTITIRGSDMVDGCSDGQYYYRPKTMTSGEYTLGLTSFIKVYFL